MPPLYFALLPTQIVAPDPQSAPSVYRRSVAPAVAIFTLAAPDAFTISTLAIWDSRQNTHNTTARMLVAAGH